MQRLVAGILAPLVALLGFYLWGRSHPYTVSRSVEIAAPAGRVWAILTDLASYRRWNPEITVVSGQAVKGGTLTVRIHSTSGTSEFHPTVQVADPGRELRWLGHYQDIPGLADGEHRFTIEPADPGRVRFTQAETFRGIAVPFFHGAMRHGCSGFDAMNAALKARAESGK